MAARFQRILLLTAALALALALVGGLALYLADSGVREAARSATTPDIGGPFTLVDHEGREVTEAALRGHLNVLYFGYTYCPDVCPTGLFKISRALDALGADAEGIQFFFVTVDPERDDVAAMRDYVANFHPRLIGLTGGPEQIAAVAKAYRVYYAKAPAAEGKPLGEDYLVDHTALAYVMGPDGRFREALSHNATVAELSEALREHLDAGA